MDKSIRKLAINDIYRIGTPDAAVKLVPFLWDEDEDFSIYVAWHLGVLLKQPEVEEKLSKYTLTKEQTPVDELTYIWRPFENNSDSALFTITSRLAYLIQVSYFFKIPTPILSVDPRIIIPMTVIEGFKQVKTFNLREQMVSKNRKMKFSSLDPDLRQILFNRLLNSRTPSRNDWIKLYTKGLNYNFEKSWHYYTVLVISFVLSLIAMSELLIIMFRDPINMINLIVTPSFSLLILYFWVVLWQGIEEILEPRFFMVFSLLGIIIFLEELQSLLMDDDFEVNINLLYNVHNVVVVEDYDLSTLLFLSFSSMIIILILITLIVGVGIWGVLVLGGTVLVIAGVTAATIAATATRTEKTEKPEDIVLTGLAGIIILGGMFAGIFGTILSLFIQRVVNDPEDIVLIKTVLGTWTMIAIGQIVGIGLGSGYRAKDKIDWGRYLTIFAFPFFCTFPVVLGYCSYAFYDWFGLSWQEITIIWIAILGVCTVLWKWGQKLDYEARNPFKGILDSVKDDGDDFN